MSIERINRREAEGLRLATRDDSAGQGFPVEVHVPAIPVVEAMPVVPAVPVARALPMAGAA